MNRAAVMAIFEGRFWTKLQDLEAAIEEAGFEVIEVWGETVTIAPAETDQEFILVIHSTRSTFWVNDVKEAA